MAYTKTNWVNGGTPPISAANLNNIENGIYNCDNAINHMATYSTSEIPVGTWIDGKTIYRKVIDLGQIGQSSTYVTKTASGLGIDKIVKFEGYLDNGAGTAAISFTGETPYNWRKIDFSKKTNGDLDVNIYRDNAANWWNWLVVVIIEYTKLS